MDDIQTFTATATRERLAAVVSVTFGCGCIIDLSETGRMCEPCSAHESADDLLRAAIAVRKLAMSYWRGGGHAKSSGLRLRLQGVAGAPLPDVQRP